MYLIKKRATYVLELVPNHIVNIGYVICYFSCKYIRIKHGVNNISY